MLTGRVSDRATRQRNVSIAFNTKITRLGEAASGSHMLRYPVRSRAGGPSLGGSSLSCSAPLQKGVPDEEDRLAFGIDGRGVGRGPGGGAGRDPDLHNRRH